MKKKSIARSFLSILIVAVMVVSLLPTAQVFAMKKHIDFAMAIIYEWPTVGEPIVLKAESNNSEAYYIEIEEAYYIDLDNMTSKKGIRSFRTPNIFTVSVLCRIPGTRSTVKRNTRSTARCSKTDVTGAISTKTTVTICGTARSII